MKKGSKKQSNVTRILNFFKEGDENEVTAVLILMCPIIRERKLSTVGGTGSIVNERALPAQRRRRQRLNGSHQLLNTSGLAGDVESHKERVAHALAAGQEE